MEGPSLYLAQLQLKKFKKQLVQSVSGNTKLEKERLVGKKVLDIFAWGKHLLFQFDNFAVRIHFLLYGTFEATVEGKSATGDYKKAARTPRLAMVFKNGHIEMYNCSVKFVETSDMKKDYDFSIDIMSDEWDPKKALRQIMAQPDEQVADVLLDQEIFAGVGNIIKNEILSLQKINPKALIKNISKLKLVSLIKEAHDFSDQFLAWRKKFVLRKNLKIHRKGKCPHCGAKIIREKTGKRNRWSYYCPVCQAL